MARNHIDILKIEISNQKKSIELAKALKDNSKNNIQVEANEIAQSEKSEENSQDE